MRTVLSRVLPVLFFGLGVLSTTLPAAEVGVRIRFGLKDKQPEVWDGYVTVKPGTITHLSGWRFEQKDQIEGTAGWTASTRAAATVGRTNNPKKAAEAKTKANANTTVAMADNGVMMTLADVQESTVITVTTKQGNISFALSEIPYGKYIEKLDGAVEIERIAASKPLTTGGKTDDDYPSAAVGADGTVYVAYISFTPGIKREERTRTWEKEPNDLASLATPSGGDQLMLRVVKKGASGEPIAITETGADIYKSATALAGDGTLWIFWAQNKNYKPYPINPTSNFDIWGRSFKDGKLGDAVRISDSNESDVWPVATTDSTGKVWVAWQGARNGVFKILARRQDGSGWSNEHAVSAQSRNCWAPAIATTATKGGRVAIAWDTYEKGDYDIWVREFDAAGKASDARPVVNTEDYEARPALTYDREGALWVSWEQSGPTWGKDYGALVQRKGINLYQSRQIGLAVLKDNQWMEPPELLVNALPGATPRRRVNNQRVPAIEPGGETRQAGREAEANRNFPHNNIARMVCDQQGRIWLFARSRHNDFRTQIGSVWMTHATYYDGNKWVGPILVPHSDNLLYNSPAVVAMPDSGVLLAHSTDHRQDRHVQKRGANALGILEGEDPFENDLFISRLESPGAPATSQLVAAKVVPHVNAEPSKATIKERAELARIRDYRANVANKELRIVRGEFHRHTEISGDGGNDGPLEDMWRYAIDVAAMDWLGCGDHDNGGHREYPWWLTQKTTDAFHLPGLFEPPFTYERSVRYPEGHRNVVIAQRGVRTLPRLPITDRNQVVHAPDTQMLYKYLKLFNGVCASHTSATSMGTDWRDHDPLVEPMVEIYQGARQNYERPGAPRCPSEDDSIGGWEPKGFVNLALLKGYKFSFQSSSDHGSTHISYALVFAENNSRAEILKAMRQRHTYAATDNIIADFRCKVGDRDYMMGDEFATKVPPTLRLKLVGTEPFAKVTLVKDDVEIPLQAPDKAEIDLSWTDPNPTAGKTSYYYVRGEQADGELVWASPMWITYQPN